MSSHDNSIIAANAVLQSAAKYVDADQLRARLKPQAEPYVCAAPIEHYLDLPSH